MSNKKILVVGSRSFAALGLCEHLEEGGHEVSTFNRGKLGSAGLNIFGSVLAMSENTFLEDQYDIVINFIIMKECSLGENRDYIMELLAFCRQKNVSNLIHISSVSVYGDEQSLVSENSEIEVDPRKKGGYGSLKVIQDLCLLKESEGLGLTLIRPGFILGAGLVSPTVGMGLKLFNNCYLQIGGGKTTVPVTTRELVHEAIARAVSMSTGFINRVLLVVDIESPGRRSWLKEYVRLNGGGVVLLLPRGCWSVAGFLGGIIAKLYGKKIIPKHIVNNMYKEIRYVPTISETFLEMSFSCDWRKELASSMLESGCDNEDVTE